MPTTLGSTQSEFSAHQRLADEPPTRRRGSFRRYLIAICIGVGGTLAWQSYGEDAKQIVASRADQLGLLQALRSYSEPASQMVANWFPQLGSVNSSTGSKMASPSDVQAIAPDEPPAAAQATIAPPAPVASSHNQQQVEDMAADLAALRLSMQQLATVQQTVGQLAAGQEQMTRDIARMQAAVQDIRNKISASPVHPAAPASRNPVPTAPPQVR